MMRQLSENIRRATILATLLAAHSGFALAPMMVNIDREKASQVCMHMSDEILDLVSKNVHEACGNFAIEAGYSLHRAGQGIREGNFDLVVYNLGYFEKKLKLIQFDAQKCPFFAPRLEPYLPRITALKQAIAEEMN